MKYFFLIIFLFVGCAEISIKNSTDSKEVLVDGIPLLVLQRSASEYVVVHKDFVANNTVVISTEFPSRKFLFERAIEKASGCKVISSLLSPSVASLTAFVKCE
jgi:hypothetical protein